MKPDSNLAKINQSQTLAQTKSEIGDTKLLVTIEALRAEIKNEIQAIHSEIRTLATSRSKQDEKQKNLQYELHQIGEKLQKLDQANQYTQRLLQELEKEKGHQQQVINQFEKDIQRLKSLLRVD